MQRFAPYHIKMFSWACFVAWSSCSVFYPAPKQIHQNVASLSAKPFHHFAALSAEHVLLVVLGRIPHYLLKIIHSFDSTFLRRNRQKSMSLTWRNQDQTGILTLGQACMMWITACLQECSWNLFAKGSSNDRHLAFSDMKALWFCFRLSTVDPKA